MLKVITYSVKGTKLEETTLPKGFEEKENLALLAQAVRVYEERSHFGMAKAKTRAEINRTKKKWYKQKGTGGARHGARSAPIFVGGGSAHGPKLERRELTLPFKMRQKALAVALSLKAKAKELVVLSGISEVKKTTDFKGLLSKVINDRKFTVVLTKENAAKERFLRNIKNVQIVSYKDMNAFVIFKGGLILIDKDAFKKVVKEAKK
jgi:large subunit ribosomal protein L4